MKSFEILNQITNIVDKASDKATEYSSLVGAIKGFILDHFGNNGLYAAYIVLGVVVVLIVSKLAKITFSAVKYLVIPSVALAFLATFFLPYSFVMVLPITVTFCSLFLLFKG